MFIDTSSGIGFLIKDSINNITGSMFLTMLGITLIILVLFIAFRIPILASLILELPLILVFMAYEQNFIAIGGVILIYLAVVFALNYFLK